MGAFLSSVRLDFSHIFLLEMKKDQLGVLPNRSYHHIQRANCNFSSGIVAFARYFQLFLSVNIKRITQTLYQYLRDWMAGAEGFEPSTKVLETHVLPLHHAPLSFDNGYYTEDGMDCQARKCSFFVQAEKRGETVTQTASGWPAQLRRAGL